MAKFMGSKATLLLLFVWYSSVFGGRILSAEEDLELEKELQRLNKPALETIQTIHGEMYNCVDFYQQPAFDNPLLKNHSFRPQMKSTSYPRRRRPTNYTSLFRPENLWVNRKGCPFGTVPIKQITKDDLINAKKAAEIYASNLNPQTTDRPGAHVAVLHTPQQDPPLIYNGAGMISTLHNPPLTDNSQYSSSHMKIQNGQESIAVGWTVNPKLYSDSKTRFFIYTRAKDRYCFNNFCGAFIQVSSEVPLGFVFDHLSTYDHVIAEHFYVYKDSKVGVWRLQIEIGSEYDAELGNWPLNIFKELANPATYIEWGGEVYSPSNIPSPQMGTGNATSESTRTSAACGRLTIVQEDHSTVDAYALIKSADVQQYKVIDEGYVGKDFGHILFYGGKGGYVGN